jgi:hypothetical protein
MTALNKFPIPVLIAVVLFTVGCNKSLVVKNVDYSQQIETVLNPDNDGMVHDVRHGISYSVMPFQFAEFQDTSKVSISNVRMIRNSDGYYFITADDFKHVYVMAPTKGKLKLKKKILVDEKGLNAPAFNWRHPIVQLLDQSNDQVYLLNENGIYKEEEAS